jgi:hypothetical protein
MTEDKDYSGRAMKTWFEEGLCFIQWVVSAAFRGRRLLGWESR